MVTLDKAIETRNRVWFKLQNKSYKISRQSRLIGRLYKLDVLCNKLAFSNLVKKGV
jgi:hypothetical protein